MTCGTSLWGPPWFVGSRFQFSKLQEPSAAHPTQPRQGVERLSRAGCAYMSESVRPAVRGIGRGSCVQIHVELLRGGNSRRIAVAVAVVVGAASGDVFTLGRLCELPDFGERNAAPGGACRGRRKTEAGGGRPGGVDRPVDGGGSA